jgi:RecA-family ATPase
VAPLVEKELLDAFVKQFSTITDEKERRRVIAQINMRAAKIAPDEAVTPDVRSLRTYLEWDVPIPPSLVWPTIAVRGEITTTLGRAGKGKTTMNLNRIFAWAAGRPLFPGWVDTDGNQYLKPEKPLRTMIAENEGNAGMFHRKMGIMLHQGPLSVEERELALENIYIHGDGGYSGLKLDNEAGVKKLRKAIEATPEGPPDILFIEPFRSLWRGEENSATDMAAVVDNMVAMGTDYDMAIILSHHERKSGPGDDGEKMSAGRGSTVLEGVVAVMENFESIKDGEYREMTWSKARYLPPPTPVRMTYNQDSTWYDWVPQSAIEDGIIKVIREAGDEPPNLAMLSEELGETQAKLRKFLNAMTDDKRLIKMPSQSSANGSTGFRWRLPSADNTETGGLPV